MTTLTRERDELEKQKEPIYAKAVDKRELLALEIDYDDDYEDLDKDVNTNSPSTL